MAPPQPRQWAVGDDPAAARIELGRRRAIKEDLKNLDLSNEVRNDLERLVTVLRHAEEFASKGIQPPRVLLLGSEGVDKVQIAAALAAGSDRPLVAVHALELKGSVAGESSERIRKLFERAQAQAPCILFIDGIDRIATKRGSLNDNERSTEILNELLVQITSPTRQFLLMASVSDPENLDTSVGLRFAVKINLPGVTPPERDPWKDLVLRPSVKEQLSTLLRSIHSGGPGFNTLIFGPPGTGKTAIIRLLARSSELRFFAAGAHDFRGQYVGQVSNRVRDLFEKVRSNAPSILYIDLGQGPYSDDCLLPPRSDHDPVSFDIVCEVLCQLDLMHSKRAPVFVIAETFHFDQVDPAVVSRFERRIEIPLPDESERREILKQMIRTSAVADTTTDVDEISASLARSMPGASGRDLNYVVRTAVRRAEERSAHRDQVQLSAQDLVAAAQESRMYVKE